MESSLNKTISWKDSNVCCCCLQDGCYKDISSEYNYCGHKEIYKNMLNDTFNLNITYQTTVGFNIHICDGCITKLRDATAFKHTVTENEMQFAQYMACLKEDIDKAVKESGLNVEAIKVESSAADMDFAYDSYDDNEILANIKQEVSQNDRVVLDSPRRNYPRSKTKLECKMKPKGSGNHKNDWRKIIERRGSGPILRDNSLKLIANSTICVFQWNRSRYTCFCCQKPFSDINELREHTQKSHTLKNIEKKIITQQNRLVKVEISKLDCQLCCQSVSNLSNLCQHLTDAHNINFVSKEHLLVPFKIEMDLQCQLCCEKFNVFRLLNIHMNRHYQNQVCHICGVGFSNLVFLNLHKSRSHRPIKCKHCELIFNSRSERKTHEMNSHNIKYERKLRFPCAYCPERFFQEYLRVLHLVEKHGFKKPEFKCNICCKVFITKSLCNNHVKNVHMKEKVHECEVCHSFFYTKSDVTRHKVTHSGVKNFACTLCNNQFASKDSLRRHTRRTHLDVH